MIAGRFLSTDEVLMEVDDEEMDWGSDEDKTLLETDLENSDESDDDGNNDTWRTGDSDLLKHPFTVQNPGVHRSTQIRK